MAWTGVLVGIATLIIAAVAKVAHEWLAQRNIAPTEDAQDLEAWFWRVIEWIFGAVERGHTTVATGFRMMLASDANSHHGEVAKDHYYKGLEQTGVDLWNDRVHFQHRELAQRMPIPEDVRVRLMHNYSEGQVRKALQEFAIANPTTRPLAIEPFIMAATDEEEAKLIKATAGLGGLFDSLETETGKA